MRTDLFDFELPREAIAQRPAAPRDSARLLQVTEGLSDHVVSDLPRLLRKGDLLVGNDTRVLPARLAGRRCNDKGDWAKVEVTLNKCLDGRVWQAFAKPARKLKPGQRIVFGDDFSAEVLAREPDGLLLLGFDREGETLMAALEARGVMPLPPYIARPAGSLPADRLDYQTVFAERPGAVAAPTAGLHFTDDLLRRLEERGIGRLCITLHVGGGTFLPVKSEQVEDHKMHSEWGRIDAATAARINDVRAAGGRIVALGTTSLRVLETAAAETGEVRPFSGETDIFIRPGYRFKAVDLLFTNFHLPRSTLFMLVSAFSGLDRMKAAYAHARDSGYRFFSYGDACLLHPKDDGT